MTRIIRLLLNFHIQDPNLRFKKIIKLPGCLLLFTLKRFVVFFFFFYTSSTPLRSLYLKYISIKLINHEFRINQTKRVLRQYGCKFNPRIARGYNIVFSRSLITSSRFHKRFPNADPRRHESCHQIDCTADIYPHLNSSVNVKTRTSKLAFLSLLARPTLQKSKFSLKPLTYSSRE